MQTVARLETLEQDIVAIESRFSRMAGRAGAADPIEAVADAADAVEAIEAVPQRPPEAGTRVPGPPPPPGRRRLGHRRPHRRSRPRAGST